MYTHNNDTIQYTMLIYFKWILDMDILDLICYCFSSTAIMKEVVTKSCRSANIFI